MARGFTLLELVVVVCVVALLGVTAIDRLLHVREQAEKAMVEQNIAMLKAAVRFQVAERVAANRTAEIAALAGRNPADWLEEPLPGYRGEFAGGQAPDCRGCWFFDSLRHELVYLPDRAEHLQPGSPGGKAIRVRVEVRAPQENAGGAAISPIPAARLVVEPYQWFGR